MWINFACTLAMENYVLYEELPSCAQGCVHYKGRRRRSIHFVSIEKCDKANKEAVANAVREAYRATWRLHDLLCMHIIYNHSDVLIESFRWTSRGAFQQLLCVQCNLII